AFARAPHFIQLVRQPQPPHSPFLSISVSLLRRLGVHDLSLACGQEAYKVEPNNATAISVALAHESRGEVNDALRWYGKALEHEPKDIPTRLSMGDLLLDNGRDAEAEKMYSEVLAMEPEHPWALPSALFLRFFLRNDDKQREQLEALAEKHPDTQRAVSLSRQLTPFLGYLPDPSDSITNLLKQAWQEEQKGKPMGIVSSASTSLEAPSNHLVFALMYPGKSWTVTVSRMHQP